MKGDIESANGHLKQRMDQHLLLRGSRDFQNVEEYGVFLIEVLERTNRNRMEKVLKEWFPTITVRKKAFISTSHGL